MFMRKKFGVFYKNNKENEIAVLDVIINNHFTFYIIRDHNKISIVHEKGLIILPDVDKEKIEASVKFFEAIMEYKKATIWMSWLNKKFSEAMEKNELMRW